MRRRRRPATRPPDPPGAPATAELTALDHALPGTLSRRYLRCGKANCRCKADPPTLHGPYLHGPYLHGPYLHGPYLHGPYLHWTCTVAGKTVTRTLTQDQASRYQPWFDNARRLRELITELEAHPLHAFNDAED